MLSWIPAWFRPVLSRRAAVAVVPTCVLAAVIAAVYAPAVKHFPHSDQLSFFHDILGRDGFCDLVSHTYSYNRTRLTHPGDTQLFRPVFFVWLSGLHASFGTWFEGCQVLGVALHLVVCILLFHLLRRLFRAGVSDVETGENPWRRAFDALPFAMTLFFALNYAGMEQVVWYNIQPNMLAVALILGSVLLLLKAAETPDDGARFWPLAGAWLLMLVAAFTYELGQLSAGVACLFLLCQPWGRGRRRVFAGCAFLAIVLIYQSVNLHDRTAHARTYTDDVTLSMLARKAADVATAEHAVRYVLYTAVQPFLPCNVQVYSHGKVQIDEMIWFGTLPGPWTMVPALLICGLWLALVVVGSCRAWTRSEWALASRVGLIGGIGLGQATLIVLGRMNLRSSPVVLALNSHYTYIALLFTLACSAAALAALRSMGNRTVHAAGGLLAAGFVAIAAISAVGTFDVNVEIADVARPQRKWLRSLRDFVTAHRCEPDFSFALAWNDQDLIPHNSEVPMPIVFYHRFANHDHPKYVLCYGNHHFWGMPVAEWRCRHPDGGGPNWVPDFVGFEPAHGLCYQIYRRNGCYYAPEFYQVRPLLACSQPDDTPWLWRAPDLPTLLQRIHASLPLSEFRDKCTWAEHQSQW